MKDYKWPYMITISNVICYWYSWSICSSRPPSAIKYAKVKAIRNENGIAVDFETTGIFLIWK